MREVLSFLLKRSSGLQEPKLKNQNLEAIERPDQRDVVNEPCKKGEGGERIAVDHINENKRRSVSANLQYLTQ